MRPEGAARRGRQRFDVAVIGAGAAGMMAAAVAGQRGLSVVLIDHAEALAEKIRISGGGRCNFTNLGTTPAQFLSRNPHFCRSALSAYTPQDFLGLVRRHRIAWHEKHRGQLFCDDSSQRIIDMLRDECDAGQVAWRMPWSVTQVSRLEDGYRIEGPQGSIEAQQLVVASGGMALPQVGATDFALKLARQFGLKVVEPRPALVPLVFDAEAWKPYAALSGVAMPVRVSCANGRRPMSFDEDMLFTHRGLSGPAILQISSYWQPGEPVLVDFGAGQSLEQSLLDLKQTEGRQPLGAVLGRFLPKRLAECWLAQGEASGLGVQTRLAELADPRLRKLGQGLSQWAVQPTGTAGYRKAEVMRGGVDTDGLDQRSMQAKTVPGLYFIGEAVDVTGWLGGYNFQWAWASGAACGRALSAA